MRWKTKELRAIKERPRDFEGVEDKIKAALEERLYLPLLHALGLPHGTLSNARETPLERALLSGDVVLREDGTITGAFNAAISKELRALGFRLHAKSKTFRPMHEVMYLDDDGEWKPGGARGSLEEAKAFQQTRVMRGYRQTRVDTPTLPPRIVKAAANGERVAAEQAQRVTEAIRQILPEEIAQSIKAAPLFDSTLWNLDRQLQASLQGYGVGAALSADDRKRIAGEWQNNLELWVTDFTAKEIRRLREMVQEKALKGIRRQDLEKEIRKSFGVSVRKAKFLARQETGLMMAKLKESRYTAAGVTQYKWVCVAGSALHPVRPSHKILEGKIFSWNDPPITSAPGEPARRNNPGQDFNCRCYAKPVVRFLERVE